MRAGIDSGGAVLRFAIALAVVGCSSSGGGVKTSPTGGAGAAAGAGGVSSVTGGAGGGGATDAAGAGGTAAATGSAGAAGDVGSAGAGGAIGVGGASGASGSGGAGGASGASGAGGASGAAGANNDADLTKIRPTVGCGQAPGQALGMAVRYTMQTSGTKVQGCADSRCGDWSFAREYFVTLPATYDQTKAYPIFFEGPGCGGTGANLYALDADAQDTVIRVGLSPSVDAQAFHATNPGQGCFDDKEGDDSVDFVFYEALYDHLAATLCFDRNRLFAGGNSSGAWLGNELGCKYAGDAQRPVRAVLSNTGGLPTDPRYAPTCTSAGMAAFWAYETDSDGSGQPFTGDLVAAARAIVVDKCDPQAAYDTTNSSDFPIGGGNAASTCKLLSGCAPLFPLVVCKLAGTGHSAHLTVVNPGFSTFIRLFEKAPLLAP